MYDVMILGGGPAGLTAGIYAARGGLKTVLIEKKGVGGQASITPEIENYPGVAHTDGFTLTFNMQQQAESFGVEFVFDSVTKLSLDTPIKSADIGSGRKIEAKAAIISSGANARKLGLERENELIGKGISYCATCDGAFFKNRAVAVVGGGNTAVEDALYLQKFASKVYLIHRRNELRASKILAEEVKNSSVEILWDSVPLELIGAPKLEGLKIKNVKTNEITQIAINGLFVAVGQTPATEGFEKVQLDESGYILAGEDTHTNLEGVYAAGDVRTKPLRQIVTAAADGAVAATAVIEYLNKQKKI